MSRARVILLGSFTSLFACLAIEACSSDEPSTPAAPLPDAASDSTPAPPPPPPEAPCNPDADILAEVQDAAIGEAGASTTGICSACMKERCAAELAACAKDCVCQTVMTDAIQCYMTTQSIVCLGELADYLVTNETRTTALALGTCARTKCPSECAIVDAGVVTPFDAGDASMPDDAGSDAGLDAPDGD